MQRKAVQPARSTFISLGSVSHAAAESVAALLSWWVGELCALVPAPLRQIFSGDEHAVRVHLHGAVVQVERGGHPGHLWELPTVGAADLPSGLEAALRESGGAVLVLPATVALRRRIELPLAAGSELHSATSFLVERLTPFRLEQVCHAARPIARDKVRKILRAEMAVVPRQTLEAALAILAAHRIPVSAVRLEGDTGKPAFDFTPPRRGTARPFWKAREAWRPVLALGLALMLIGPLTIAYRADAEATALAAEVKRIARAGGRAAALRKEVEEQAAAEAFISARQHWPKAIEVLDALTRTLPDSTWLFRIELRPGQAVMAGFSADVPDLLERLTKPPFAAPELISPVMHGAAGGKSRFELRVQLKASTS